MSFDFNTHNWFGEVGDYIIVCPSCEKQFWSFKYDRFRFMTQEGSKYCFRRSCPICKCLMIVKLDDCTKCKGRVACLLMPTAVAQEKIRRTA